MRDKSHLRWLLVLIGVLALTIAACAGDDEGTVPEDDGTVAEDEGTVPEDEGTVPEDEGTVPEEDDSRIPLARVGLSGDINTMDAAAPRTANDYVPATLVSGLLYRHDFDRVPQFDLLESEDISDDGLTVTHTLRPDLLYSDGTPVVADDAVFAYERIIGSPGEAFFQKIERAEAPDDRTIVWHLSEPFPDFPDALAQQYIWLHPREQLDGNEEDYFQNPVSAGPYMIEDWTPGPTMRITANPNYWGTPVVETIEFQSVTDLTSRVLQLSQGDLDYVFDLPTAALEDLPDEVRTWSHGLAGMYHISTSPNVTGPLADPRVRQAISLAIDRASVGEVAFHGLSAPACAYVYTGVPEHECMLPNDGARDLDAARALLEDAGHGDGFEFELQTWTRPGWTDAILIMAENLSEIGITAEVAPVEDSVAVENLQSGAYELQFSGNVGIPFFFLTNMVAPGTFWANAVGYDNPELVGVLQEAGRVLDVDRRRELLVEVQLMMYEDALHLPVAERTVLSGSRLDDRILQAVNPGEYIRVALLEER